MLYSTRHRPGDRRLLRTHSRDDNHIASAAPRELGMPSSPTGVSRRQYTLASRRAVNLGLPALFQITLPNLNNLKARWLGDLVAILPHRRKVHFDSLGHAFFNDLDRRTGRDAARKIWYMSTKASSGRCDQNGVGFHNKPACLSIDFSVFRSTSSEACPAMVTFPGFLG